MRLIDATPFSFNKVVIPDGTGNFMRGYGLGAKHVCDEIDAAPTVEAVPIKAISAWLAANALQRNCLAQYAKDWENDLRKWMREQEEQDGTDNP